MIPADFSSFRDELKMHALLTADDLFNHGFRNVELGRTRSQGYSNDPTIDAESIHEAFEKINRIAMETTLSVLEKYHKLLVHELSK